MTQHGRAGRISTGVAAWMALRAAIGVLILAAAATQATVSITRAVELDRDVLTTTVNVFSFFTILSNISAGVVLLVAAGWYATRGRRATIEPRGLALALGAVTTYMVVTGIVYNLLLRGIELPIGSEPVPWSNEMLHAVGPVFLAVDAVVAVLRRRLRWRAVAWILVFPVVWVVYTLVRGPLVTNPSTGEPFWYPYPFLDPNNPGLPAPGYAGVAIWILIIGVGIAAIAAGVVALSRWRGRDAADVAA